MSEVGFTTPLLRRRALQVFATIFMTFWLSGFISSMMVKTCKDFDKPAEERWASCNRHWWVSLPVRILLPEWQEASLWLAFGAASADMGQTDTARSYYRRALLGVGLTPPVTLPGDLSFAHDRARSLLGQAVLFPQGSAAERVFLDVMADQP